MNINMGFSTSFNTATTASLQYIRIPNSLRCCCSSSLNNNNKNYNTALLFNSVPASSKLRLGLQSIKYKNQALAPPPTALRDPRAAVVTKDTWESSVLKSELPVLIEFYASWCGPCMMVHRVIDEIAVEYAGKLNCFLLNTDNDPQITEDYNIKAVPVVLLIKNGVIYESVAGTMPKEFYEAAIERVLKS